MVPWSLAHASSFRSWGFGFGASIIITVTFLAVAAMLAVNLTRTQQWRNNPLAIGTFLIFLTCGGGHLVHTWFMMEPWFGFHTAAGDATRDVYGDWHAYTIDAVTAFTGLWYWRMRRHFPELVQGTALFEDLQQRQKRALEIHDNVVQSLARAKLALEVGAEKEGEESLQQSLEASKKIITDLLGREAIQPGDLKAKGGR